MPKPSLLQYLQNAEFNFHDYWGGLSSIAGLNYEDFQISRVSLKDAVEWVDQTSWVYLDTYSQPSEYGDENQTILDELFLIYHSDRQLFNIYSYEDFLNGKRESIFMKVNDSYNMRKEENFSHYCIRLKRNIDILSEVQGADKEKKPSDALKYLVEDLIIRLDYATKRIGTEKSQIIHKITCGLTRDKIVALLFLLLDLKIISGINKIQLNDLIAKYVESTGEEDFTTGEIKKRLSRVYKNERQYIELITAWREFDKGPLTKMADRIKIMTSKSAL